jgi:phage-related protein
VTASRTIRGVGREADTTAGKLRDIGSKGLSPLMTAAASLGPALLPVLAGATVAAGALGVATVASGAALGVFAAVSKTAYANIGAASKTLTTAHTALATANAKVTAAEYALSQAHTKTGLVAAHHRLALAMDAQSKAAAGLAKAQAGLSGPLGAAAAAQGRANAAWKRFVDLNSPAVYGVFRQGFDMLTAAIPKLEPLFKVAAGAASYLLGALSQFTTGGGLDRLVKFLAGQADTALYTFISVMANVATGVGALGRAFGSVSGGISDGLVNMAVAFKDWAVHFGDGGGFTRFIGYAKANGPALTATLASIAVSLVHITAAVAPLAPLSLAVARGLSGIVNALPTSALTGLVGGYVALNVALKLVAAATSIATAAQAAFDVVMTANPIGILVVTLAALAVGIVYAYKHFETFRNIVNGVWSWIKDHWPLLLGILLGPLALAAIEIVRHWRPIAGFFTSVAGRIVGATRAVISWFATWPGFFSRIWRDITGFFTAAGARIAGAFGAVVGWFEKLPGRILTELRALPGQLGRLFIDALNRAAYAFGYGVGTIIRIAITVVPRVLAAIRTLPGQLWGLMVAAWGRARAATEAGAVAVVSFFASLPGRAARAVSKLWSAISGAFRTAASAAAHAVQVAVSAVVSWFQQLPGRAGRAVSSLWSAMSGAFRTAASAGIRGAQDLINGVIRWLVQLPGRAASALSSMPGRIKGVFAGAGGWLISAGEDIIRGLITGIGHMAGAAAQAAANVAKSALNGAKAALHIGSPSRVFADEVGRWIPAGIAAGITAATPDLLRTMSATMGHVAVAAAVPVSSGGPSLSRLPSIQGSGPVPVLRVSGGSAGSAVNIVINGPVFGKPEAIAAELHRLLLRHRRLGGGVALGLG